MHALNCDQVEPLLPAAAAGALDGDEQAAVQAHVLTCATCLPKLADYEGVVELLAYAVPQVAPPPDLLPRLLRAVETPAPAPLPAPVAVPPPALRPVAAPAPRRRVSLLEALLGIYRRLAPVGFALALLVLALVGGWSLTLNREVDQQREMIAMLRMPNSHTVALQPMTTTAATAQAYMAPGHAEMALVVQHLMPQPGRVYQLWLIMKDGSTLPAGTVQVDAYGMAVGMIQLPADPAASVGMRITDEAGPQPPAPTGTTWLEAQYDQ